MSAALAVAAIFLTMLAAGCAAKCDEQSYGGRKGQERYCTDNGWTYVPSTNECRYK